MQRQMLIAHRGESVDAPENTCAAISLAWELEDKAVEIDIHLTADRQIVVLHDADTRRVAGENFVVKETLYQQLSSLDVGAWKGEKFRGEKIPLLADVLKSLPAWGKLVIEIKCGAEIVPHFAKLCREHGLTQEQVEVISFQFDVLAEIKKTMPQYKCLWLVGKCEPFEPKNLRDKILAAKLDGIDISKDNGLDKDSIALFRREKLLFYVWTVDSLETAKALLDAGADGITSNHAHFLRMQLGLHL